MLILEEKHKLIKKISIPVISGRNKGKTAGELFFRDFLPAYYLVTKSNKQDQIWRNPIYTDSVNLSKDIIERDLIPRGVKYAVFLFVGFENNPSFFIVVKIKEFIEKGRLIEFDDKQYEISFKDKKKFYSEKKMMEELQNEDNENWEGEVQSSIQN